MTDFYFAIGPNPKDVFVVVGEKRILYKHCETEDLAKAIVDGQNKRREGKRWLAQELARWAEARIWR